MPIIQRTPESDDLVPLCQPRSPIASAPHLS